MVIKNASFLTSAGAVQQILCDGTPEIAVVGRSNVGKSSFINLMTNNSKLAKTSKEPGRTRLVNYFKVNNGELYLVDLPGYGFARVSDAEKLKWGELIEAYLRADNNIRNVFVLLDIRRDASADDVTMLNYLYHYNIPFTIIATKADKLSRSAGLTRRRAIANELKVGADDIIITSALDKVGKEAVLKRMEDILSVTPVTEEE